MNLYAICIWNKKCSLYRLMAKDVYKRQGIDSSGFCHIICKGKFHFYNAVIFAVSFHDFFAVLAGSSGVDIDDTLSLIHILLSQSG